MAKRKNVQKPNSRTLPRTLPSALVIPPELIPTLRVMGSEWFLTKGSDHIYTQAEQALLIAIGIPGTSQFAEDCAAFEQRIVELLGGGAAPLQRFRRYCGATTGRTITIRDLMDQVQIPDRTKARLIITLGIAAGIVSRQHSYWVLDRRAKVYFYQQLQKGG